MYKKKNVLDLEKQAWSLITAYKNSRNTLVESLISNTYKEMGIKIENVKRISEYYYFAKLTDSNVNNIQRSEHQLLDFFTLDDIKKLLLTKETSNFIIKHSSLVNL